MIKVVTTLRKKKNMSTEDFRDYYERKHRLIGEKYLSGYAIRYVRHYMNPITQIDGVSLLTYTLVGTVSSHRPFRIL